MIKPVRWLAAAFCFGLAAPAPTQAQASWDGGMISVIGGYYFAPIFAITHTDPRTRLTGIRIDDLPDRVDYGYRVGYSFSFIHPYPWYGGYDWEIVGDGEWTGYDDAGYRPTTFGWEIIGGHFVHRHGFQGSVELPVFDESAFFSDPPDFADPDLGEFDWNVALAHANVTVTTVNPEPWTVLLLGTGLAMIGFVAWRRREESLPG